MKTLTSCRSSCTLYIHRPIADWTVSDFCLWREAVGLWEQRTLWEKFVLADELFKNNFANAVEQLALLSFLIEHTCLYGM
ncbi:hypothetical protein E2986_13029 [Frieseomelitta varia]|uniref:Uncharacterized protein n=1 Tax=Frieseomelitta varia TaxID=561572 RepID=A0A833RFG7_9HYME|nr:hypothetical protein E2986_13029 [Frieseomelitta varia]